MCFRLVFTTSQVNEVTVFNSNHRAFILLLLLLLLYLALQPSLGYGLLVHEVS
jgi:hypothetical protein